jgi:calcineurin-like phosphoesterase family protein
MRFIGDVHGHIGPYLELLQDCDESIQVGDLGMGFLTGRKEAALDSLWEDSADVHRFIRGNHDDPGRCKESPGWIKDGTYDPNTGMMLVGGALSIDKDFRTPGVSWWHDEELSSQEFYRVEQIYITKLPRIMVTHDAPDKVTDVLFKDFKSHSFPSRTSVTFQDMFEFHQPDIWIFGHWHQSAAMVIDGTQFICLAELETFDFDL